jgi:GDPmannose 4,6-dehydratase
MLEAIRLLKLKTRFYNASTSEIFGSSPAPQSETTPFHPCSPYGCAKLYSHHITVNYREAYGLWAVNGILFNHESPRRGETFVTRKITIGLNRLLNGYQDPLLLGNVRALRDWGHARDYVLAMWLMLQQDKPEDYVIATGESRSVADFVTVASRVLGREVLWVGNDAYWDGQKIVAVHKRYERPLEVPHLQGDASKARRQLGWAPKTTFTELVKEMLDADAARAARPQMAG